MSRAPETGYYFEPMTERLALVLDGAAFPSDDGWAYIGDPLLMPPEVALLEVAMRWPGVDPETLEIEYETDFRKAVEEIDRLRRGEEERGSWSGEVDFDVAGLIAQAEELKAAAAQVKLTSARELAESVERAAPAEDTIGGAIERANPSGRKP